MSGEVSARKKSANPHITNYESYETVSAWLSRFGPNTSDGYRRDLTQFTAWLGRDPLDATRAEVQAWIGHLRDAGRSPATVRRKATSISSFLAYALEEGLVAVNVAAYTRRPRGANRPKAGLTVAQTKQLLGAARTISTTAHALILLLVTSGLRISEAVNADLTDLTTDGGHDVIRVTRKGGDIDFVPVAPSALEAIASAAGSRETGPLLMSARGRRLSRDAGADLVRTAAQRAGLDSISPHILRHTAATQAIEAGEPLEAVQALLGHKSPATTERYLQAINRVAGAATVANRLAETFGDVRPDRR